MRASFKGGPIQGAFYPESGVGERSIGDVLPKILGVLALIALLRMVVFGGRHGVGRSMRERRREKLAELHRELHRADDAAAKGGEVTA